MADTGWVINHSVVSKSSRGELVMCSSKQSRTHISALLRMSEEEGKKKTPKQSHIVSYPHSVIDGRWHSRNTTAAGSWIRAKKRSLFSKSNLVGEDFTWGEIDKSQNNLGGAMGPVCNQLNGPETSWFWGLIQFIPKTGKMVAIVRLPGTWYSGLELKGSVMIPRRDTSAANCFLGKRVKCGRQIQRNSGCDDQFATSEHIPGYLKTSLLSDLAHSPLTNLTRSNMSAMIVNRPVPWPTSAPTQ